jgi:hypothetical protein
MGICIMLFNSYNTTPQTLLYNNVDDIWGSFYYKMYYSLNTINP